MCRPMGRRTETSMAPSSRRQRLATLAADRVIDAVLALASLSTLLGTTAGRGSGAHNICAGHGSCASLLAALTGLIQHRLKRPHGHPQKPADPDRRDVAARSGVIGPIAAQSEIFLPGRGDRKRKQGFFTHNSVPFDPSLR